MRPRTAKKICLPARSPRGVPAVVETTIAMPIAVRVSARKRMRRSIRRGRISASRDIAQFTRALAGPTGRAASAASSAGVPPRLLATQYSARRAASGASAAAPLAVLHEDDGDDLRVVPWREAREPAVITQLHGKEVALPRFLLSDDLNGAGLAAEIEAGHARGVRGAAGHVHDTPEALDDRLARAGRVRDRLLGLGAIDEALACAHVLADVKEVRRRKGSVRVRDAGHAARDLQRGHEDGPLADRDGDRLTEIPRMLSRREAPGRRRNDAALFIGKIDAGRAPEAEEPCRLGDRVDPEPLAHRVEVRIARDLKSRREVHVSVMTVAAEEAPVERGAARTKHALFGVDAVREDRVSHVRFPDGSRRVHVLQRAVVERVIRIRHDVFPFGTAHALGEEVRVVRGSGKKREDLARLRVERHGRADLVGEIVRGDLLEREVDCETQRVPGQRRVRTRVADLASERIDDIGARAREPGEKVLIRRLDALLTDAFAGAWRIRVEGARLRARGHLLGRGLAEVAQEMSRGGALRVHPALGLLDDELRMLERARLDGAHLGDREVLLEHDGHEVVVRAVAFDATLQVVERAVEELGDKAKGGVEVLRLAAVQEEREGGLVLGEDDTVAVEDEASRRRHGHTAQAVVLGLALVRLAPEHLMDPVHAGQEADENPRAPRNDVDARENRAAVFTH